MVAGVRARPLDGWCVLTPLLGGRPTPAAASSAPSDVPLESLYSPEQAADNGSPEQDGFPECKPALLHPCDGGQRNPHLLSIPKRLLLVSPQHGPEGEQQPC